ncbi:MAG: SH3 domain-containing protein [Anaerolineaceae bacterium]|nr:SH3 domain-containing protein [Anaerolineaceae bacterium]
MRKFGFILLVILCMTVSVSAQNKTEFVLQVVAESAFMREMPAETAKAVGSVYANASLIAVGRNMDGEWLQVERPGFNKTGGWIARKLTLFTFSVARLPITDSTTGLLGNSPVEDSGFSVLLIIEAALRNAPSRFAAKLATIPLNLTLPVLERTPDNQWLKINYRGYVGWVAEYTTRMTSDINSIPVSPEYAGDPNFAPFESISPEVQLSQIDRLVTFLKPVNNTTTDVVNYWRLMSDGETMECLPPAGSFTDYDMSPRDLVELPELRRQSRLLKQAIADINTSISMMQKCGVYTYPEIQTAYAKAINAHNIFTLILKRMEILRKSLVDKFPTLR